MGAVLQRLHGLLTNGEVEHLGEQGAARESRIRSGTQEPLLGEAREAVR